MSVQKENPRRRFLRPEKQMCIRDRNYIEENQDVDKIGVIYSNDDVGKGGLDSITEAAEEKGKEVVSESFANEDKDMTAQLSKLRDEGAEACLLYTST